MDVDEWKGGTNAFPVVDPRQNITKQKMSQGKH